MLIELYTHPVIQLHLQTCKYQTLTCPCPYAFYPFLIGYHHALHQFGLKILSVGLHTSSVQSENYICGVTISYYLVMTQGSVHVPLSRHESSISWIGICVKYKCYNVQMIQFGEVIPKVYLEYLILQVL